MADIDNHCKIGGGLLWERFSAFLQAEKQEKGIFRELAQVCDILLLLVNH